MKHRLISRQAVAVPWALATVVSALTLFAQTALAGATALPQRLSETGLFTAGAPDRVPAELLAFEPQYPLWSDGAHKQRWISLPAASFIDASDPDRWVFPVGTRLWKTFSHDGRRVETRFITLDADGGWRYATYLWADDGGDAVLAPAGGVPKLPLAQAPGGHYAVPSRSDCLACHEGAPVPVLGVGALQLSDDRDPGIAPGRPPSASPGLRALVERGWLHGLPASLLASPPRIEAGSAAERAALGYLHANCGHCHNDLGAPAPVALQLAQRVDAAQASRERVLASLLQARSRFRPQDWPGEAYRVVPGQPQASVLRMRMGARQPQSRMPPLGSTEPDPEGLALIDRWITHLPTSRKEPP